MSEPELELGIELEHVRYHRVHLRPFTQSIRIPIVQYAAVES
ncbi:hypothetical protein ABGV43_04205 [Paenibacillus amylolyticus]